MHLPTTAVLLALLSHLTAACLTFSGTENRGCLNAFIYDGDGWQLPPKCQFHNLLLLNREEWMQCEPVSNPGPIPNAMSNGRHHGIVAYAYNGINFRFNVDSTPDECLKMGEGHCIAYSWKLCARVYGCPTGCSSGARIAGAPQEIGNGTVIDIEKLPPQDPSVSTQWVGEEPSKPVKTKASKPFTA